MYCAHRGMRARILAVAGLALAGACICSHADADTLEWALAQAYQNNPSLNAQRALVRATDEHVPQALSGYRPTLSATANAGFNYANSLTPPFAAANGVSVGQTAGDYFSRGFGATATQTLFNGLQTANRVRQAESQVEAARETLRVMEQQVLLDAATAYMNVLRDHAILDFDRFNVIALTKELKVVRDNYVTGALPSTDVAQAESRLAGARASLLGAQANYVTSLANYRRVIGVDAGKLAPGAPIDRYLPKTLTQAIAQGEVQNPSVLAAMYGVDGAALAVKISEGSLYPNLAVSAGATRAFDPAFGIDKETLASIVGQLIVPVYQGGSEYSLIRQSKETLGQQRLSIDVNRDQARATVMQSWGQIETAKAQIEAAASQVNGAEVALNGVRDEALNGQRTTIDVLNAQQELVNARIALITAQHDRVVSSYALLAAVGELSMQTLGLNVAVYDPGVHYHQVRDAWTGVRTPDGR